MSASHLPVLDAIAFQLVAALERYESDVGRMCERWLDMELYRAVSGEIEDIRMYCASLPQLSVPWVELLIAHTELVHALWRSGDQAGAREVLEERRFAHAECIQAMRARCLKYLER